jgi:hypothetical protein
LKNLFLDFWYKNLFFDLFFHKKKKIKKKIKTKKKKMRIQKTIIVENLEVYQITKYLEKGRTIIKNFPNGNFKESIDISPHCIIEEDQQFFEAILSCEIYGGPTENNQYTSNSLEFRVKKKIFFYSIFKK